MRRAVFSILLASVVVAPALAAPPDEANRQQARTERQQAREARQAARDDRVEANRPQVSMQQQQQQQPAQGFEPRQRVAPAARAEAIGRANPADLQALRDVRRQQAQALRVGRPAERSAIAPQFDPQGRRAVMRDRVDERLRYAQERIAAVRHARPPVISTTPQPGAQPPPPAIQRPTPAVQWSSNWRRDNRYDWDRHRRHHRSLFNLGFYYDPFGWGYQPYAVGWRMWPSYYRSQYWLSDPWQYRLPYAPAGYRWVRYWDDAVLVDTWSGEVVDVIYSFFW